MLMLLIWIAVVTVAILYGTAAFGLIGLLIVWTITGVIVGGIIGGILGREEELGGLIYLLFFGFIGGVVSFYIAFNQLFTIMTK